MLRALVGTVCRTARVINNAASVGLQCSATQRSLLMPFLNNATIQANALSSLAIGARPVNLLHPTPNAPLIQQSSNRTVTKFSLLKGKRKTVKAVVKRFKRLDWGIWIRTHTGRHKKLFKKSSALKRRLKQHVFTNATQSWLLDSMVTNFWRRPKHYIDDPYEPYHRREEYFATKGKTFKV